MIFVVSSPQVFAISYNPLNYPVNIEMTYYKILRF